MAPIPLIPYNRDTPLSLHLICCLIIPPSVASSHGAASYLDNGTDEQKWQDRSVPMLSPRDF
jgi:hypothetical protein